MPRCSPLSPPAEPGRAGPAARALAWLVPDGNPSALVYGTILAAALLAVESGQRESLFSAAASVVVAVVILWLAKSYAAALGDRLHQPVPWTPRHLASIALHEASLLQGAVIPVAVLLVAAAAGAGERTAVLAALISAVVVLFVLELAAGVASHLGRGALIGQVLISGVIGAGVLAVKALVH